MKKEKLATISINDLKLSCIVGVYEQERHIQQEIIINIHLVIDIAKAAKTDTVEDTLDYKKLYDKVISFVENSSFQLLESLVEAIAELCLEDKKVKKISVSIQKPKALPKATSSQIEIFRENA